MTEPTSPLPAAQNMKRGTQQKEIWLSAKGEELSFTISLQAGSTGERNVMAYRNHRNAASRLSIYQTVTDRIIASLKAGMMPWEKPWKAPRYAGVPFPRNFYTGKHKQLPNTRRRMRKQRKKTSACHSFFATARSSTALDRLLHQPCPSANRKNVRSEDAYVWTDTRAC